MILVSSDLHYHYHDDLGHCKSWTLDSGLDGGLDFGPNFGPSFGLIILTLAYFI